MIQRFTKTIIPFFLLVGFIMIGFNGFAQTEAIEAEKYTALFDYLSKNEGTWGAFNPDFKAGDTTGFKDFVLKFTKKDALSIEGNIYGINAQKDTIPFWSISEFYAPYQKKAIIIQRSADGNTYAMGTSKIVNTDERVAEMEFFYPNGVSQKHKDIHLLFGEDKMRSTSYNYDKNNAWKMLSTLVWERKYGQTYDYKFAIAIPHSKRLLFVSDRDGDDEIYSMDIDGKNVKQLTDNEAKDFLPAVSPDGKTIIFTSQRDRKDELYSMHIDGSNQTRLTNNDRLNNEAAWSPDGQKIAFLSQPKQHTPPCLFIMNPDGTGRTKVTKSEGLVESFPNWSKSGKYISYTQGNNNGRNSDSYVYEVATGKTFAAAESEHNEFGTHWLDSDKKLLFSSNRTGNYHIYLTDVITKKTEQLTFGDFHESSPKTGIRPNSILFISDRSGPNRIYTMDLQTKELTKIEAEWKSNHKSKNQEKLAPSTQKHPSEAIEYLIGTWELDFGKGIALMDFAWGENKSYVTCIGKNKRDGKIYPEFFSLIFWDGVQEKFAISSAYTSPGDLLSQHGTMMVSDTSIFRDLVVHYAEGEYMPFLKKKAGKGGFAMPYRQTWKIIDKQQMKDFFEVKIEGVWQNPFGNLEADPSYGWTKKE